LVVFPTPNRTFGRFTPWGRLAIYRHQYDEVINRLIDKATTDADLDTRDDVLAVLLKSRYADGSTMSAQDISDELLGLMAAGHETTAATLSWAFERITRHPSVLDKLNSEADGADNAYRHATIAEVQRVRTVIDFIGRQVCAPSIHLGEWAIPRNTKILVAISQLHSRSQEFPEPQRFCPDRYLNGSPPSFAWLPFGAGMRRCVGAAFAELEMDVVLRTILQHFIIYRTDRLDEKVHPRGIANTPADGGLLVVRRRPDPPLKRAAPPRPDR
jgi:cytochrome P450